MKNLTNQMVADPGLMSLLVRVFLQSDVEIGSDRIISIRVGISSIVRKSRIKSKNQTRIRHHLIRWILHRQTQKIKERNVKIRKSVASIEKITRQTRPGVMNLMTKTHLRKVIIDVNDAITRNIG